MVQLGESIPEIAFSEGVSKGILHACSIVPYDGHITGLGSHHPINRDHEKNEVDGSIEHLVVTRMLALSDDS